MYTELISLSKKPDVGNDIYNGSELIFCRFSVENFDTETTVLSASFVFFCEEEPLRRILPEFADFGIELFLEDSFEYSRIKPLSSVDKSAETLKLLMLNSEEYATVVS